MSQLSSIVGHSAGVTELPDVEKTHTSGVRSIECTSSVRAKEKHRRRTEFYPTHVEM